MAPHGTDHEAHPTEPSEGRSWNVLALLAVAQFMVILDVTVVNVALPSIGEQLGFAAADLHWVVTAYVLFTGGLLLLGGRMSDLLGRRQVLLAGVLVFTAASLASALATSPETLIPARAAQGVGAAMLSPAALSILTTTYTGAQRTTALSIWGAVGAGGAAAGLLLGGILTSAFGWEAIFLINVPIGLVAAALALHLIPASQAASRSLRELDLPGALAVVGGLVVLIYAVEGTTRYGWTSAWTLSLLAIAAISLSAFAWIERRSSSPLVPSSTWRARSLVSSATVMLGATGILVGGFFLNTLLLQHQLAFSPLETGLAFLPLVLLTAIAAHAGPQLMVRLGARGVLIGGLALVAAGQLLLSAAPEDPSYALDLMPAFALFGFGAGLAFVGVTVTAMSEVSHKRAGLASGLMTTAHEVGAAFGVALFSAIALGAGAGAGADASAFAQGYGEGTLAAALVAGVLAVIAAFAVPAYRPTAGEHVAMH